MKHKCEAPVFVTAKARIQHADDREDDMMNERFGFFNLHRKRDGAACTKCEACPRKSEAAREKEL